MNKIFENLKKKILATNGKFFTVIFTRRRDGSTRKMLCRTKKRTGNAPYDADKYDLIHVWDIQVRDWRSIPLEGVTYFKCGSVVLKPVAANNSRKKFLRRIYSMDKKLDQLYYTLNKLSERV